MIIDHKNNLFDAKKHNLCIGDLLIFTFAGRQVLILVLAANQCQHIDCEVFDIEDYKLLKLTGKEPWGNLIYVIRNDY
jgi:hypothetical protein